MINQKYCLGSLTVILFDKIFIFCNEFTNDDYELWIHYVLRKISIRSFEKIIVSLFCILYTFVATFTISYPNTHQFT